MVRISPPAASDRSYPPPPSYTLVTVTFWRWSYLVIALASFRLNLAVRSSKLLLVNSSSQEPPRTVMRGLARVGAPVDHLHPRGETLAEVLSCGVGESKLSGVVLNLEEDSVLAKSLGPWMPMAMLSDPAVHQILLQRQRWHRRDYGFPSLEASSRALHRSSIRPESVRIPRLFSLNPSFYDIARLRDTFTVPVPLPGSLPEFELATAIAESGGVSTLWPSDRVATVVRIGVLAKERYHEIRRRHIPHRLYAMLRAHTAHPNHGGLLALSERRARRG